MLGNSSARRKIKAFLLHKDIIQESANLQKKNDLVRLEAMGKKLAFDIGEQFRLRVGVSVKDVYPDLGTLISSILPNVYILAGLILFVLLLFGGFSFIMGAGGGNPDQANKGKQAIGAAVAGFGLIFASYWIMQIIKKLTGIDFLNTTF
jgi:hypothetical protein